MLDLIGSFIIGSLLLMMILRVNINFNELSTEDRLELMTQENLVELVEEIEFDFRKIAYGLPSPSTAITAADTSSISFQADIDNDGSVDQISYVLGPVSGTPGTVNPRDRILTRTFNGQAVGGALGVIDFQIVMYDGNEAVTTSTFLAKAIEYSLIVESPFTIDTTYARSFWTSKVYPKNL